MTDHGATIPSGVGGFFGLGGSSALSARQDDLASPLIRPTGVMIPTGF
jgi:hypothetical protein